MLWSNDAEVVGGACSYVRVRNRPGLESQRCTAVRCKHTHKKQQSAVFGRVSRFCAAYYVNIWTNDVKHNRAPKRDIFIVLVGNFTQIIKNFWAKFNEQIIDSVCFVYDSTRSMLHP